jgi:predicted nuclease with RNAse H fold
MIADRRMACHDFRVACWMGVDVGGRRKGFDVALVEGHRLTGLRQRQSVDDVVAWVGSARPRVVAVDSPRSCAAPGRTHRPEERELRRAVCGIRWTPARSRLAGNPYYEWIVEGLRLYDALAPEPVGVIECFPTASWTRWHGARNGRRRSVWTRDALAALNLQAVPPRTNQDMRDAIGAALTARDHDQGRSEAFGEIVVPSRLPAPHALAALHAVAPVGGRDVASARTAVERVPAGAADEAVDTAPAGQHVVAGTAAEVAPRGPRPKAAQDVVA